MPRTRVAKVKNPWRVSDGLALLAELQTSAVDVAEDDDEWETLLLSRKRTRITLIELIEAIRAQRLAVGQQVGIFGFHGIVVLKRDVERLQRSREPGPHAHACAKSMVSAAEFGRSVGLRDNGHFLALIEFRLNNAIRRPHDCSCERAPAGSSPERG
ncbi:hypothetical protein [Cereibacter sediminicola]|uniref:hypothetical protein n=1 Tax=Cereibacter sediminicola TaxID=2584941 RepID=UPI001FEA65ED|nr:hypothetical protein [Cereibacter sediminicola]